MANEINTKRQLNFGFMLDNQNKRKGGFLKDKCPNLDIEAMFDPKLDEEIASWFYGDETDIVNQIFKEMAEQQAKSKQE